jgi:hypothetical protein
VAPRPESVAVAAHAARAIVSALGRLAGLMLPGALDDWLRRRRLGDAPVSPGAVRFGDLRRLTPMSRAFGFDAANPWTATSKPSSPNAVDIAAASRDRDAAYTRRFGGNRVTEMTLHVSGEPDARSSRISPTVTRSLGVVRLRDSHADPSFVRVRAAVATLHRILAPGGCAS